MPASTLAVAHHVVGIAVLAGALHLSLHVLRVELIAKLPRIVAALRREPL